MPIVSLESLFPAVSFDSSDSGMAPNSTVGTSLGRWQKFRSGLPRLTKSPGLPQHRRTERPACREKRRCSRPGRRFPRPNSPVVKLGPSRPIQLAIVPARPHASRVTRTGSQICRAASLWFGNPVRCGGLYCPQRRQPTRKVHPRDSDSISYSGNAAEVARQGPVPSHGRRLPLREFSGQSSTGGPESSVAGRP